MTEAVRLVVWDLDETFWKGTITEGGIIDYVEKHHSLVIELAKRGIMSSICSKNDPSVILPILQEKGILEYFIFPSISWDPKGMRLAQLVDAVQLRAPSILFIDDNPNNRAEAIAIVPGIQVEDETFIDRLLDDPRFKGKNDSELSRLKQYKLLEQKKGDEQSSAGSNEDFLRSCDVRVLIEYDVVSHIDRAIELVSRTNQLNYTKLRFSDDPEKAREELRQQMRPFDCQAGLIRVADKYGDYGFVGFFLTLANRTTLVENHANTRLVHFCFSCRTLGMLVEKWLYDFLGQPELNVIGNVLTDLRPPKTIDWIRLVDEIDTVNAAAPAKVAPEVMIYGGCEAHMVGLYLKAYADSVKIHGNFAANGLFVRLNNSATALDICDRSPGFFKTEADLLGVPTSLLANDFFSNSPAGTIFVFNLSSDAGAPPRIRHKDHGWVSVIEARPIDDEAHFFKLSEKDLQERLVKAHCPADQLEHILRVREHLLQNYEVLPPPTESEIMHNMRDLISRTPKGSKIIAIVNHHECRPSYPSKEVAANSSVLRYRSLLESLADEFAYFGVLSVSDAITGIDDILEANHHPRQVYLRVAQNVIELAGKVHSRADTPASRKILIEQSITRRAKSKKIEESRTLVQAAYIQLLRRDADPTAQSYIEGLSNGKISPADFLRSITSSAEFRAKWSSNVGTR